ncbi:hypothetical protein [Actinokineospora bangkokensis]|uniref:Uncharacterized protein n=1 Tax=Actinokineospora bangkokensis TaxID=1193682 RepID=A0A1Q9LC18_9PSEU|nr:hypothetical protein [Actinokineospora bangkokensis]OLR89556.1 hypothetical protein BJP25_05625 [Actinokineospora bangkokensis]
MADPVSALHQFAISGRIDRERITDELATIYSYLDDDAEEPAWVEWLTRYVVAATEATLPADQQADPRTLTDLRTRLDGSLRDHRGAFRAYLRLPGVRIDRPDMMTHFADVHLGSFENITAVLEHLVERYPRLSPTVGRQVKLIPNPMGEWHITLDTGQRFHTTPIDKRLEVFIDDRPVEAGPGISDE